MKKTTWLLAAVLGLSLSACACERGAIGEPGSMGPKGDPGEKGDPGQRGERGERGEDGESIQAEVPSITSIFPSSASSETIVTIAGTGFDPQGGNEVLVDGSPAQVITHGATELRVKGLTTGIEDRLAAITVFSKDQASNSVYIQLVPRGETQMGPFIANPAILFDGVSRRDAEGRQVALLLDEDFGLFELDIEARTIAYANEFFFFGQPWKLGASPTGRVFALVRESPPALYELREDGKSLLFSAEWLEDVGDFTVDDEGFVYLTDIFSSVIHRISPSGEQEQPWFDPEQDLHLVQARGDSLYVTDDQNRLYIVSLDDPESFRTIDLDTDTSGAMLVDDDFIYFHSPGALVRIPLASLEAGADPIYETLSNPAPYMSRPVLLEDGGLLLVLPDQVLRSDGDPAEWEALEWSAVYAGIHCPHDAGYDGTDLIVLCSSLDFVHRVKPDGSVQLIHNEALWGASLTVDHQGGLLTADPQGIDRINSANGEAQVLFEAGEGESLQRGLTEDGEGTVYFAYRDAAGPTVLASIPLEGGARTPVLELDDGTWIERLGFFDGRLYFPSAGSVASVDVANPDDVRSTFPFSIAGWIGDFEITDEGTLLLVASPEGYFEVAPDGTTWRAAVGATGLALPSSGVVTLLECNVPSYFNQLYR